MGPTALLSSRLTTTSILSCLLKAPGKSVISITLLFSLTLRRQCATIWPQAELKCRIKWEGAESEIRISTFSTRAVTQWKSLRTNLTVGPGGKRETSCPTVDYHPGYLTWVYALDGQIQRAHPP